MAHYKLKKGQTLGALSAESDHILDKVFVDTGYLEKLLDIHSPSFLIIGRTGSGKTAIIKSLEWKVEKYSNLDPDELSMQYLHSNHIIKFIKELGVHLDIFLKFLWRHIIVLELIKLRYSDLNNSKNMKETILTWLFPNPKKETENIALNYLEKHGNEYWITADTHIKAFTKELEENISTDRNIEGKVNFPPFKVEGKNQNDSNNKTTETLRGEVKERVQSIVNNYQISALNEIIKKMSQYSFNDPQKKYYLIIDDLDKNWMPDDALYLELLKSLLHTVKEINQKLTGVKIIIALRTNIYHRIFKKSMINEPQREKWNDVISEIHWKKSEIKEFVDKRLSVVFREKYTKDPPTIEKILPPSKRKSQENSFDYLLNRTFYRPRDVLSFLNHCVEETDGSLRFSWSNIRNAEIEYSKERLNSIIDEWKNSYFGLHALFNMIGEKGPRFCYTDITDSDIDKILNQKTVNECKWLKELFEGYCEDKYNLTDIKNEFLKALYTSGLLGFKDKINNRVYYSFEKSLEGIMIGHEFNNDAIFEIHKSFWKALGINKID